MSVLIYSARNNWSTKRVSKDDVIKHLLNGWHLVPYSAIKE